VPIANIINWYNNRITEMDSLYESEGQGKARDRMGQLYQDLAEKLILDVDPSLTCKHNDYFTLHAPSGKYSIDKLQVDLHVYRNDVLLFILESKTWLDKCYLVRALSDFEDIRKIKGNIPAIVWAGQDAVAKNAVGYYNEIYNFETFICNVTKRRNAKNPVYKTCDPLDEEVLGNFQKYVRTII
jgi:hypothetical protein